jgi:hypothetical protein
MKENPLIFSRHGGNGYEARILTQVYAQTYPAMAANSPVAEKHPFFELYRLDCAFFANPRKADKFGYPVDWEMDWLIEVENNSSEFAMHLRGLLDFIANHRLAIFFSDTPEDRITQLTPEFAKSWDSFASKYRFANELDLHVAFFPERYTSYQEYANSSRSICWDGRSKSFRRL